MKDLSSADIASLLTPHLIETGHLSDQIRIYIALLLEWNRKISLTAVTDPVEIVRFHFGESLFAASALEIRDGRLADVGSGAGFLGFPSRWRFPPCKRRLLRRMPKRRHSCPRSHDACSSQTSVSCGVAWKMPRKSGTLILFAPGLWATSESHALVPGKAEAERELVLSWVRMTPSTSAK